MNMKVTQLCARYRAYIAHAVLIDLFNTPRISFQGQRSEIGEVTAAHSAQYGLSHGANHCHCENDYIHECIYT